MDTRHKITDRQERAPGGKSAAREEVAIKADTTVMIARRIREVRACTATHDRAQVMAHHDHCARTTGKLRASARTGLQYIILARCPQNGKSASANPRGYASARAHLHTDAHLR